VGLVLVRGLHVAIAAALAAHVEIGFLVVGKGTPIDVAVEALQILVDGVGELDLERRAMAGFLVTVGAAVAVDLLVLLVVLGHDGDRQQQ
jgi:hypothetical protein